MTFAGFCHTTKKNKTVLVPNSRQGFKGDLHGEQKDWKQEEEKDDNDNIVIILRHASSFFALIFFFWSFLFWLLCLVQKLVLYAHFWWYRKLDVLFAQKGRSMTERERREEAGGPCIYNDLCFFFFLEIYTLLFLVFLIYCAYVRLCVLLWPSHHLTW